MVEIRSAQQIWQAALGELQIQVNKPNYRTWLENTVGLSCENNQFVIGAPNTFVAEYLDSNQHLLIQKILSGLVHHEVQVQFQVATNQPNLPSGYVSQPKNAQQAPLPLFNPKYTFDSFVVGNNNRLAYSAALETAQNPGRNYNPLFIYAGAGLGKTHLLQAMGHLALAHNFKALYVSAEHYTNELMTALRERKTDDFRHKYRSVDMLLVDDVQFFGGKAQTGENFFHTFNELHNANHQIALASDSPPKAIPLLPARLRTRFEGGLVTTIELPDLETRFAILQAKAKQEGADVATDVLEFLAHQMQVNIRALEGSLNRVIAYAKLMKIILTPELAAHAIKDITETKPKTATITPEFIIRAIVEQFQLTPEDLRGKRRDKETTLARRLAMYFLRQETNRSLAQIGQELGRRDAAAVSHAYQKITGEIETNPYLKRQILEIQQRIRTY